jgi:hypothetical protein
MQRSQRRRVSTSLGWVPIVFHVIEPDTNSYPDIIKATAESNGRVSPEKTIELASVNLERLLGIDQAFQDGDMVAWARGSPLDMQSSVAGVVSSAQGWVDLL